ncbi:MAG: FecR domain-containing protein [Leptospirales bacterium]|nr:FecR domain-containing protein [Leptospirales bacterium]
MLQRRFPLLILGLLVLSNCAGPKAEATVQRVQGDVQLLRGAERRPLLVDDSLHSGDHVLTGEDGIAILHFANSFAAAELQPNADLEIKATAESKELNLQRGNLWLQVNGGAGRPEFSVRTPTTVAAVRGTRFYTVQIGDMVGICQCQGTVHFQGGGVQGDHHQDTLSFTRGGKTVTLQLSDLPAGIPYRHDHSLLNDSPVGARSAMTPEMTAALLKIVNQKFAELP